MNDQYDSDSRFMSNVVSSLIEKSTNSMVSTVIDHIEDFGIGAAQCLIAARTELGKFDFDKYSQYRKRLLELIKAEDATGVYELTEEMDDQTNAAVYADCWGKLKSDWRKLRHEGWEQEKEGE